VTTLYSLADVARIQFFIGGDLNEGRGFIRGLCCGILSRLAK
jgi:hypothetical protein